jgi:hypothetical protein
MECCHPDAGLRFLLSRQEIAYLSGSKDLTSKQRRDIRYRLNKKLKLFGGSRAVAAEVASGKELNSRAPTDSSMATVDKQASLDMAGTASSNLARPTSSLFSFPPLSLTEQLQPPVSSIQTTLDHRPQPPRNSAVPRSDITTIDWQQFHQFLLQRMIRKTAEDRLRYAKQYGHLLTSAGRPAALLQLTPNKRIHIMKALSCLAIFTGQVEEWQQIRKRYRLSWSTGTEKLDAFARFFNQDRTLDTMIQWLREALSVLSTKHASLLFFSTLTGLRGSEAVESIRLLNAGDTGTRHYHNPAAQVLEHFRYPDKFLRRTKSVNLSIVNEQIIGIAKKVGQYPCWRCC